METKTKTNPAAAFESRNFRLATAGWIPMESPSGFRYLAHPFGLALEISQGPMKGEQHFSSVWQFLGSKAIPGHALPESQNASFSASMAARSGSFPGTESGDSPSDSSGHLPANAIPPSGAVFSFSLPFASHCPNFPLLSLVFRILRRNFLQ